MTIPVNRVEVLVSCLAIVFGGFIFGVGAWRHDTILLITATIFLGATAIHISTWPDRGFQEESG